MACVAHTDSLFQVEDVSIDKTRTHTRQHTMLMLVRVTQIGETVDALVTPFSEISWHAFASTKGGSSDFWKAACLMLRGSSR